MGVPYLDFDRRAWAALRAATPLTLTEADLAELQGLNERVSLAEVETIYLPVSRLLNLHVAATQGLHKANDTFLGSTPARTPYVIGVARQRGGGEEHVRAHPAGAARTLARSSPRGSGHDRRLPVAEPSARSARTAGAQGLS